MYATVSFKEGSPLWGLGPASLVATNLTEAGLLTSSQREEHERRNGAFSETLSSPFWGFYTDPIIQYNTDSVKCLFPAQDIMPMGMPRRPKQPLPPLSLGKETIGERIARLRKERGYTQRELADRIGIIHSLVSDYEKSKLRLYDQMVARFALALEVSADEILGLKGNGAKAGKPTLKIVRRLGKIELLPPGRQKTILKAIDFMIQSAERQA